MSRRNTEWVSNLFTQGEINRFSMVVMLNANSVESPFSCFFVDSFFFLN